jgi:hypothetical protein
MSFITADIQAPAIGGVTGAITSGGTADMIGIVPPPIGTLIAEIQLDPVRQLVGGTAGATSQPQAGSTFPLQSDSSLAGSSGSLPVNDEQTPSGVFKGSGG